jgi:hypothetical protein
MASRALCIRIGSESGLSSFHRSRQASGTSSGNGWPLIAAQTDAHALGTTVQRP